MQLIYWLRCHPAWFTDPLYLFMAKAWIAHDFHHVMHYHLQPLFPLAIAAFIPLTGSAETASQLVNVLASALTVVPIYFLALRHLNLTVARLCAFFWPLQFFQWPLQGEAEVLQRLFLFSALAVGSSEIGAARPRRIILAGALFGLACLTKIEAQLYFPLWAVWVAIVLIRRRMPGRRVVALLAVSAGAYLLVMSPYLGGFYRDTGRLTLNPKTCPLFFIYNEPDWTNACYMLRSDDQGMYTVYDRVLGQGYRRPMDLHTIKYAWANRARIGPAYLDRLGFALTKTAYAYLWLLMPGLAPVAGIMILASLIRPGWTRRQAVRETYLASFGIVTLISVPLFGPTMRFFSALIPLLIMSFSRGIEQLWLHLLAGLRRARGESTAARAGFPLLIVLATLAAGPNLALLGRERPEVKFYEMLADKQVPAEWLHDHLLPGQKIMSAWLDVAIWYLAGINPEDDVFVPKAAPKELIAYARQENVEFLLVENGLFLERYPELRPLLEPGFKHPDLEREFEYLSPHGRYFVIYRVLPAPPRGSAP